MFKGMSKSYWMKVVWNDFLFYFIFLEEVQLDLFLGMKRFRGEIVFVYTEKIPHNILGPYQESNTDGKK